jgi:membrane-bound lytic murein transglycosylase B
VSGKPLPNADVNGAIILPQGYGGPAFLVYRNFDVIMEWNRSINYALAVAHLSDRLNGQPALLLGRSTDNRRMTRDQFMEIQHLLGQLGFDPGDIDGVPGSKTRLAIRAYQKAVGLPADGHASAGLLEYLHKAAPTNS